MAYYDFPFLPFYGILSRLFHPAGLWGIRAYELWYSFPLIMHSARHSRQVLDGLSWLEEYFSSEWACLRVINKRGSPAFPKFDSNPQFTRTPTDGESVGGQLTSYGFFFLLLGHSSPLIFGWSFKNIYFSALFPFSLWFMWSIPETERQRKRREESNRITSSEFPIYLSQNSLSNFQIAIIFVFLNLPYYNPSPPAAAT